MSPEIESAMETERSPWQEAAEEIAPPSTPRLTQRVRNHVNPLSRRHQIPIDPPHWPDIYAGPDQPLHLDIGTGSGRFLVALARQNPQWNFLGVEIRQPLVERANQWRDELELKNLHFLYANINVSLRRLFKPGALSRLSIQFPDPWFKKRHHKRRVVQPELVKNLADLLQPNSPVFLQSDVEEVAVEMAERFLEHPAFEDPHQGRIDHNPLGVSTLREVQCLRLELPIYRYWIVRQGDELWRRRE